MLWHMGHATEFERAGKQTVFVVRETTNEGLFSSAGRADMETPAFRSVPDFGTICLQH